MTAADEGKNPQTEMSVITFLATCSALARGSFSGPLSVLRPFLHRVVLSLPPVSGPGIENPNL